MTKPDPEQPQNQQSGEDAAVLRKPESIAAPRGLVRCPVCHEFRGVVLNRDLEPLQATQGLADYFIVLCICEGIPCSVCGQRIHNSNYWDEAAGILAHPPDNRTCNRCCEEEYVRVTGGVPGFDIAFWPQRIPRGLVRCLVCHEYRGVVLNEDLPCPERGESKYQAVLCICDGVECCECKKRFHRPRSVFWDEAASRLIKSNWCVSTRWTSGVGKNPDEARWPCNECRRRLGPPLHVSQTGETR